MDRPARPEQPWETLNRLLLRQFAAGSTGALLVLVLVLWFLRHDRRLLLGALIGGAWVIVNGAVLAWLGAKALRSGRQDVPRFLLGLIAVMVGSLAVMAWLVMTGRSSLAGISVGLPPPLLVFLLQLHQLKLALEPHAR